MKAEGLDKLLRDVAPLVRRMDKEEWNKGMKEELAVRGIDFSVGVASTPQPTSISLPHLPSWITGGPSPSHTVPYTAQPPPPAGSIDDEMQRLSRELKVKLPVFKDAMPQIRILLSEIEASLLQDAKLKLQLEDEEEGDLEDSELNVERTFSELSSSSVHTQEGEIPLEQHKLNLIRETKEWSRTRLPVPPKPPTPPGFTEARDKFYGFEEHKG